MYNLYRVSNLAVWLQQINKLYLLTYLHAAYMASGKRCLKAMFTAVTLLSVHCCDVGPQLCRTARPVDIGLEWARVKIPGTNWKQWRNAFQWAPGSV